MEAEPFLSYGGLSLYRSARGGREKVEVPQVDHFAAEMDHMAEQMALEVISVYLEGGPVSEKVRKLLKLIGE